METKPKSNVNGLTIQKVPFSYKLITSDVIMRFICLWLYKTEYINDWLFWSFQIILVPLLLFFIFIVTGNQKIEEQIRKTKQSSGHFKFEVEGSAISVIFSLSAVAIGLTMSWTLLIHLSLGIQITLTLCTLVVYGFYIWMLSSLSFGKVKEEKTTGKIDNTNNSDALSIDVNDEKLVELEISLSQFSNKVDTYTLESALLGALSFSGFLAILSLDNTVVNNIQIFLSQISVIFNNFIDFNFNISPLINLNQQTIISLLAIELIMCSFFFLLVIVSRIRFHDTLSEAELHIKMARELNNKEEEYDIICHQKPSDIIKERLNFLNSEIKKKLSVGSKRKKELEGIISYMNYVRNIGLFLFVLILSTAANLVTYKLSLVFLILYIMSYSYHKIDTWAKKRSWKNPLFKQ